MKMCETISGKLQLVCEIVLNVAKRDSKRSRVETLLSDLNALNYDKRFSYGSSVTVEIR
jgi:hypothetical protein